MSQIPVIVRYIHLDLMPLILHIWRFGFGPLIIAIVVAFKESLICTGPSPVVTLRARDFPVASFPDDRTAVASTLVLPATEAVGNILTNL